jgi:hypothetical protein
MIPTYKAIVVEETAIVTGSTKPSIMTVSDMNTGVIEGKYVVKVFNNLDRGKTAKEFYGNLLAKEFDFKVPDCALINVGKEVIETLKKDPIHKRSNLMEGYYYGSKLQEGRIENYTETVENPMELWEIENVFGFDALIFNNDRRREKPNLFFIEDEVFLIDHELAFNSQYFEKTFEDLIAERESYSKILDYKSGKFERKHLFLEDLRKKNVKEDVNFTTFNEYLLSINPNCLDDLEPLLRKAGIDVDDIDVIRAYLQEVKKNPTLLVSLLKSFL